MSPGSAQVVSQGIDTNSENSFKDMEKHGGNETVTTMGAEDGTITDGTFTERDSMKQGLHQRHIQMIALAGTIGTGLFLSSGRAIAHAGPLGALLSYTVMGLAVASVVLVVGEMGALVPLSGGVVRYAEFFVDPSMSFANGWNQVYSYCVSVPSEMVAAAVLVEFWNQDISSAVFITVFSLVVLVVALLFVRVYGEVEFVASMLKILLIVGINIMALVITCGGGPNHQPIGFQYWKNPGPFVEYLGVKGSLGNFLGFWATMNTALYAYSGAENISLAAAETKNPRRNIPRAAKRIFVRVFVFYVLTIFMVGLVVPSDDKHIVKWTGTASMSPFVVAARRAGIKVVPSIINAVIITSAWSSGNSNMLGGPRTLYGLAHHGHAPKIFLQLNRFGVPWIATCFVGAFMALGYMSLSSSASVVFNWLQDLVSVSTMVNFILILIIYLRFHYACKAQGIDRHKELPWAAPFQPYASWFSLVMFIVLFFTSGFATFMNGRWDTETFVSSYINLPVVVLLYFVHKFVKGTRYKRLSEVPIREFIDHANANPEPAPHPKKGLHKLNFLWG